MDEYERDFNNIVSFVPSVASDEREKARKFFTGLNARYREVMGRNPPTTYITAVEEARGMETQLQLTVLQQSRNGNSSNTGVNIRGFTRREESLRRNPLSRSLREAIRLSSLPSRSNQGLNLF